MIFYSKFFVAFFLFLVADTRLYTLPCRSVGRSVRPSVRHIFELRAVFALLLLLNRPRLDCRVSGLVYIHTRSVAVQLETMTTVNKGQQI